MQSPGAACEADREMIGRRARRPSDLHEFDCDGLNDTAERKRAQMLSLRHDWASKAAFKHTFKFGYSLSMMCFDLKKKTNNHR